MRRQGTLERIVGSLQSLVIEKERIILQPIPRLTPVHRPLHEWGEAGLH